MFKGNFKIITYSKDGFSCSTAVLSTFTNIFCNVQEFTYLKTISFVKHCILGLNLYYTFSKTHFFLTFLEQINFNSIPDINSNIKRDGRVVSLRFPLAIFLFVEKLLKVYTILVINNCLELNPMDIYFYNSYFFIYTDTNN